MEEAVGNSESLYTTDLFKDAKMKNFFRFVDILADGFYFFIMQINNKVYGKTFILTIYFIMRLVKTSKKGLSLGNETSEISRFERNFNAK